MSLSYNIWKLFSTKVLYNIRESDTNSLKEAIYLHSVKVESWEPIYDAYNIRYWTSTHTILNATTGRDNH